MDENQKPIGISKEKKITVEDDPNQVECDTKKTSSLDGNDQTSEEESSSEMQGFDIDEMLEEKLKKHGLNRRNAKTIIHELLNDESVLGLLKANLDKQELNTLPEAKDLRSKQTKSLPDKIKFTELPLPDDDDDEDEEYRPEGGIDLDTTLDTEASQDTQGASCSLDISALDSSLTPFAPSALDDGNNSNDSFIAKLQKCDSDILAIRENCEKEIIALRTRSKHSLMDKAMAEIETAFNPPDVTEDMYKPSGDDDWHKWLAELMLDDPILQQPSVGDDDDCEIDPDYDFLQSDTEETNDKEDFRSDHATHIPKKEVQELLQERHVPTVTFQGQLQPPALTKSKSTKFKANFSRSIGMSSSGVTVKDQLNMRRKKLSQASVDQFPTTSRIGMESVKGGSNVKQNQLLFTAYQLEMMKTQLRQHIQLLVQMNLLSRNIPSLSTVVLDTHALLKELQQLDEHDRKSFNIPFSFFNIPCLVDALEIVQLNISKSPPIARLDRSLRNRMLAPIQRNIGVVIATNSVFAYSHLLPYIAPPTNPGENSRVIFTPAEDNLLVLGNCQMQGYALPWSTLVHRYMMPCKQPDQLKTRFANSANRSDTDNPFRLYKQTGALPAPPHLFPPSVGPGTNVESHLYLTSNVLPQWLLQLQEELEEVNEPNMDMLEYRALMPRESHRSSEQAPIVTTTHQPTSSNTAVTTHSMLTIMSPMKSISILLPAAIISTQVQPVNQAHDVIPKAISSSNRKRVIPRSCKSLVRPKQRKKSKKSLMKRKMDDDKDPDQPVCKISNPSHSTSQTEPPLKPEVHVQTRIQSTAIETSMSIALDPTPPVSSPPHSEHLTEEASSLLHQHSTNHLPSGESASLPATTSSIQSTLQSTSSPASNFQIQMEGHVLVDEEEDEAVSTEDDFDEEIDFHLNGVVDSEEEDATKKEVEKKRKKKELKVKWKKQKRNNTRKLGGVLHRLHPGLMGKKKAKASEDDLSRNLRESAEKVKMLEEETIVQLDPLRVEKEMFFAQGYLKRMEETLADHPEVLVKVLEVMCEFDSDISLAPPILFNKLSKHLEPWPELIQGFAPFLMPEQAHKCGLLAEQQVYARARKFLRQLEIRFSDNQHQLTRILSTFKTIAETGVYKEQEMKNAVLSLLKSDPYLQEEFLMFFDDERPPESRLHGDYEEVIWSDDLVKDSFNSEMEHIHIAATGCNDHSIHASDAFNDVVQSPNRQSKAAKPASDSQKISSKKTKQKEQDDVAITTWDESHTTDAEEDSVERESSSNKDVLPSCPPDIAIISEDALSCSPFKRHNAATTSPTYQRPRTPTHEDVTMQEISLPSTPPPSTTSSSLGSMLPSTPTGSKLSTDESPSPKPWTFEDDNVLLSSCKEYGPTDEAFEKVSTTLGRTKDDVKLRFHHLMNLLSGREANETDTTSHYTDSESELSIGE